MSAFVGGVVGGVCGAIQTGMTLLRIMNVLLAAAAVAAGSGAAGARAEEAGHIILAANDFTGPSISSGATVPRRTLEWNARKGRWGLKFGVEQHTDRDVELKDLQPGLYYRVTPRLHIGGAVSLAPDQVESQRLSEPQMPAPRVRLETTFKF